MKSLWTEFLWFRTGSIYRLGYHPSAKDYAPWTITYGSEKKLFVHSNLNKQRRQKVVQILNFSICDLFLCDGLILTLTQNDSEAVLLGTEREF